MRGVAPDLDLFVAYGLERLLRRAYVVQQVENVEADVGRIGLARESAGGLLRRFQFGCEWLAVEGKGGLD